MDYPQTLEEARKIIYERNHLNQKPDYIEGRCACRVSKDMGRWTDFYQCKNKNGYGPSNLYCKLHALGATKNPDFLVKCYYISKYSD